MLRNMLVSAFLLAAFAVAAASLVGLTHLGTRERVEANERQALVETLHALVPAERHDNDLLDTRTQVIDPLLGSKRPVPIYRALQGGETVAVILAPVAPDGYSGDIHLLVAVEADGSLAGVRVTAHRETPGLGDLVEAERSDWITHFTGLSLGNPPEARWKVRKDGGDFDQFTGATITPRAVVKAVANTLRYVEAHRAELFAPEAQRAAVLQETAQ
ncbi:MAG: electron transport complex subunit RsxG [Thiohalomonadaceae bacterium]